MKWTKLLPLSRMSIAYFVALIRSTLVPVYFLVALQATDAASEKKMTAGRGGLVTHRNGEAREIGVSGLPWAGTLIVAPTSLLTQWQSEIRDKVNTVSD
jgi:hypothetical protein